jgi:hypothetical protein
MMVMIATLCTALGCRDVQLAAPPLPEALCQMQAVTMQAFVAAQVAAETGAELRALRCVAGVPA